MNPQYVPNSFKHKFRPDTAEAPYQVADNVVSRKSHYYHEGKMSEYTQASELYDRVMSVEAKEHLHSNTATLLGWVEYPEIQAKYLAQLYCIAPEYAKSVYDLLKEKKFEFAEVEKRSHDAPFAGKEPKFRPSNEVDRLTGYAAPGIYNM
jgi:catalase